MAQSFTSRIIIDKISYSPAAANNNSFTHSVSSSDAVLVVFVKSSAASSGGVPTVQYGGNSLIQLVDSGGTTGHQTIFILLNPAVGSNLITLQSAGNSPTQYGIAVTILGVDKSALNYDIASGATTATIQISKAGSLVFAWTGNAATLTGFDFTLFGGSVSTGGYAIAEPGSFPISGGIIALSLVAFPPAHAPSIAFPIITARSVNDIVTVAGVNTSTSQTNLTIGNFPTTFWQNSFLHTVGRILPIPIPPIILAPALTDNLVAYYTFDDNTGSLVRDSSQNLNNGNWNGNLNSVWQSKGKINSAGKFNGDNFVDMGTPSNLGLSGNQQFTLSAWVYFETFVDNSSIVAYGTNSNNRVIAMTIHGAGPNIQSTHFGNDHVYAAVLQSNYWTHVVITYDGTTEKLYLNGSFSESWTPAALGLAAGDALRIGQSSWVATTVGQCFIDEVGVWNRGMLSTEVASLYNLGIGNGNQSRFLDPYGTFAFYDYKPFQFWENSFLQTIGRIPHPPTIATVVSETEQETAQIIIDKVFQGQVAAQALSTVTLNMDISIPSQDAVLVLTGGSAIATGAKWTSAQFNGNSLINLVQAITTGADAEIWWMPNPPVGTYTLSILSGTGGEIYANAMVILGVDRKSTNIIATSAIDTASTSAISALITPDANNALIIDAMTTLNGFAAPVPDASQTQVFNASALANNEWVLSTYKISGNIQQNMNYNLSVAVNAALVAIALRPAHAPSIWFPNIATREIDDVVTVSGLDASVNPAFGNYGYKPSIFYKNSFLHTVGRIFHAVPTTTATSSTLLMLGVG